MTPALQLRWQIRNVKSCLHSVLQYVLLFVRKICRIESQNYALWRKTNFAFRHFKVLRGVTALVAGYKLLPPICVLWMLPPICLHSISNKIRKSPPRVNFVSYDKSESCRSFNWCPSTPGPLTVQRSAAGLFRGEDSTWQNYAFPILHGQLWLRGTSFSRDDDISKHSHREVNGNQI